MMELVAVIVGGILLGLMVSAIPSPLIALVASFAVLGAGALLVTVAADWYVEDGSPWFFVGAVTLLGGALGARNAAYRLEGD